MLTGLIGGRFLAESAGFGYTLKVPASGPATLRCRFLGRHPYDKWHFAIMAGADTLYSVQRGKTDSSPINLFYMDFPLKTSQRGTNGEIEIRFVNNNKTERMMPRLIEARIIRK